MTIYSVLQGDNMESMQLSAYDFVVLGIFLLFIGRGVWLGLLKQVVPLLALYVGYFAASRYHDQLFPFLGDVSDNPKVVFLTAYVILFVVTYIVAALLGKVMTHVIQVTITPWFDRLLGAILGFAKGMILIILVHMILGTILAPENQMLRSCQTCPVLNELAESTRKIIKDENIRKALRQQEPAIALEAVQDLLNRDMQKESDDDEPRELVIEQEQIQ